MNRAALLELFDREQRVEIDYPGTKKEAWPFLVRFLRPAPGTNFITYSYSKDESVEQIIQGQIKHFSKFDQPFHWKVYAHDHPADMKDRLIANGFRPQDRDMVMVLDLIDAPGYLVRPIHLDVRSISSRENLKDVIRILAAVYGGDFEWIYSRLGDHLEIADYLSVNVAYHAGRPVSAGWVYFHPGSHFASLWGGTTILAHRGQGFYAAVLAARVQLARERGYRYLIVDTGPMSRPIVSRYGFRLLTCATTCEWER
jgi:GNAT superfamily N-acetyltransferase